MKRTIADVLARAVISAQEAGDLLPGAPPAIEVSEPKSAGHGDLSTNLALVMASGQKRPPRQVAEAICHHLHAEKGVIARTEIAGPGFINFFISPAFWQQPLREVHRLAERYGRSEIGCGQKIQVEFVSSNPTGPLHVGHGRGGAVGDSLANILACSGFEVQKEYYINDSGRQIRTLGRSVLLRYQALCGLTVDFPEDCYQGSYIIAYAERIRQESGNELLERPEGEAIIYCARLAAADILAGMRKDLLEFGVTFDLWFSEQSLYDTGQVDRALDELRQRGLILDQGGAQWFRSTAYGDEKDRVVVRQNGQTTYLASDIAYHRNKFQRGFERVIDVWGADHHGYIPRMNAAVEAFGQRRDQFQVVLVQLVNLLRDGVPIAMSTRAGEFVTLSEVVQEVGRDAARFIFLTRHHDSPLEFDLDLAKKKSNDNPVYYVQYVHARISSIARKATEAGLALDDPGMVDMQTLTQPEEIQLIKLLASYPETVRQSAINLEPHRIAYALMGLAGAFHAYYNKHRVLVEEKNTSQARLSLVLAVRQVIHNGLGLLGVSAPEAM